MTDIRCNYTEKQYDSSVYEWKFRIMDQLNESAKFFEQNKYASGWNSPQATQDYLDLGNNAILLTKRKRVIVEIDGEKQVYDNIDLACEMYNLNKGTINNQIYKKQRYEGNGLVLYYLDKAKPKSSKYQGVSYNKRNKVWQADIFFDNKKKYIGSYKTELEAHEARQAYMKRIGRE